MYTYIKKKKKKKKNEVPANSESICFNYKITVQ